MADTAELDGLLDRLASAMTAAETAVAATPDLSAQLKASEDALADAQRRIEALEQQEKDNEVALDAATRRAEAAEASADAGAGGDAALQAEVTELRAARAQDLAEMKALLAELEPMLETADA